MKKIISFILSLFLIFIVVFLGIKSGDGSSLYIILFGLASAFIAPLAISSLGYSFQKKDNILEELSKLPELEKKIQEAKTQEEINAKLKKEKENLIKYIHYESKRLSMMERKEELEKNAKNILDELEQIDDILQLQYDVETNEEILKIRKQINDIITQPQSDIDNSTRNILTMTKSVLFSSSPIMVIAEKIIDLLVNRITNMIDKKD